MGDISIIEWIVYGLISYSSILMLIISTIKDVPVTKALSIIRCIYLVPGIVCSGILASSSVNIVLQNVNTVTRDLNASTVWTETVNTQFPLQSPVWQTVHLMIMLVLLVYVIQQIMIFMTAKE